MIFPQIEPRYLVQFRFYELYERLKTGKISWRTLRVANSTRKELDAGKFDPGPLDAVWDFVRS